MSVGKTKLAKLRLLLLPIVQPRGWSHCDVTLDSFIRDALVYTRPELAYHATNPQC